VTLYWDLGRGVEFDWDEANTRHLARHKVTPVEAEQAFLNEAVEIDYQFVDHEGRFVAIGTTAVGRFLVIVYTMRGEAIRIITAFDASAHDRALYLEAKEDL